MIYHTQGDLLTITKPMIYHTQGDLLTITKPMIYHTQGDLLTITKPDHIGFVMVNKSPWVW
jgi:hypothetical protein